MEILRSGRDRSPRVARVVDCRFCGCEFKVQSGDEKGLRLVSDFRGGGYYELPCPECKKISSFDASLLS